MFIIRHDHDIGLAGGQKRRQQPVTDDHPVRIGLTAIGLTLGLLIVLMGSRLIASLLFGVGAVDPLTLVMTAAVIIGVAGVASYLTARAAAGVTPLDALRAL
jgi:hypothetical protein